MTTADHGSGGAASSSTVPVADLSEYGWPDRLATRLDGRLYGLGLTTAGRRDVALALLVAAVSVGLVLLMMAAPSLLALAGVDRSRTITICALLVVQALPLCIRRISPVQCLILVVLVQATLLGVLPAGSGFRALAPMVAAYTCGALLPARRALRVAGVAAVVEALGAVALSAVSGSLNVAVGSPVALLVLQLFSALLVYVGFATIGGYVATHRAYGELMRVHASEAVETQRARADAAIGVERARMARELHDIAAHHLSGLVVQAAVVERLIGRDPDGARATAVRIRRQGREILHNLRLVVAALRGPVRDGDRVDPLPDGGAPVPGLSVLDRLVANARHSGTRVDLVRSGVPRELPLSADVTFYRVAQEALANARDHAPGAPVRVAIDHRHTESVLEIENDPAASPTPGSLFREVTRGFGLAGMRERAQLIGAALHAGPTAQGGWRVRLVLPHDLTDRGPSSDEAVPEDAPRLQDSAQHSTVATPVDE